MGLNDLEYFLTGKNKKDEYKSFVWQRGSMWVFEDSNGRSAIGNTFEEAKQNLLTLINKEIEVINKRSEGYEKEFKEKRSELWGWL